MKAMVKQQGRGQEKKREKVQEHLCVESAYEEEEHVE